MGTHVSKSHFRVGLSMLITFGSIFNLLTFGMGCKGDWNPDAVSSDCKSKERTGAALTLLDTDKEPPDLSGLYCASYSLGEDDQLQIDIINYFGNCAGPYGAKAVIVNNRLTIEVKRLSYCGLMATCMCRYDISVEVPKVDRTSDLNLVIQPLECEGDKKGHRDVALLPIATKKSGFACRFGRSFGLTENGELNHPCRRDQNRLLCVEGLKCVEGHCMAVCEIDLDCPSADIYTCSDGLCVPGLALE